MASKTPAESPHTRTRNKAGVAIPQTIAHRGNDRTHPENTLEAIKGAIEAGCHGIETDLRVSRDGVVVLCHDRTLERCYGVKKAVCDCDWAYLQTLETVQEPKCRIPRLSELLEYLAQPALEHIWVLLDIKMDNPTSIIAQTASTLSATPVQSPKPWSSRLTVGIWTSSFLPLCVEHLPDLPVALITFSISYARQFLAIPNVGFNLNQKLLMGPLGRGFLEAARNKGRAVYVWTVNEGNLMSCALQTGFDGVVTDCSGECRQRAETWDGKYDEGIRLGQRLQVWMMSLLVVLFGWIIRRKFLDPIEKANAQGSKS